MAAPGAGPAVLVDLLVAGVLALWTFVAPATDDDGYFSLQARNAALTGTVGDYVQFQNRSFTPFTWPYQLLAEWQQWAGAAPVLQRVPAAVCGLLTWVAVRALIHPVAGRPGVGRYSVGRPSLGRAAAAVAFLAWWLPYDMGVRPEPVVALCAAAAAALHLLAATRRRLVVAWLAVAVAGAGAVAHTGGVVLLGVLVAGLPLLVPLLRGGDPGPGSGPGGATRIRVPLPVLRGIAVGSAVATALLPRVRRRRAARLPARAGRDRCRVHPGRVGGRGRPLRLPARPDPHGQLRAAGRGADLPARARLVRRARRRRPRPPGRAAGVARADRVRDRAGARVLGLSPSKWTHHFGTLAGVGAAFLGLLLVTAGPLTRDVLRGARLPPVVPLAAAGSVAVVCALVWHGPNSWPYAWLDGVAAPYVRPSVGGLTLDHPLLWLALVGVAALIVLRIARPLDLGQAVVRAVPLVVAGSLAASVATAVAVFAVAGFRGTPPGSVWAQNIADPAGTRCGRRRRPRAGRGPRDDARARHRAGNRERGSPPAAASSRATARHRARCGGR